MSVSKNDVIRALNAAFPGGVQNGALNKFLGYVDTTDGEFVPGAGPSHLTDSSGGTPGVTLAAITAGGSYAQADMTAVKNAIASLNAQVNALQTALVGTGILTA